VLVQVILAGEDASAPRIPSWNWRGWPIRPASRPWQHHQQRKRYTPNFFIGEGKLADIKVACEETGRP